MHYLNFLYPALLASSTFLTGTAALRSGQKIKLSDVQSLTLRKDRETSHRRVSAIPQLQCIGGSAKGLYDVDVMRCKNSGSDYNEEDIQWTCTASLPEEFKLGSTDVICEGYDSPDDPYVLKGSCGVEYRLVLTEKGHQKFGHKKPWFGDDDGDHSETKGAKLVTFVFWCIFVGVALWIAYNAFRGWAQNANLGGGNRPGWGGGGGGGGWGGWGGNDNDDPPPPYDYRPSSNPKPSYGTSNQTWRPGFWTGTMGGAAAGYAAGRYAGNNSSTGGWGGNRGGNSGWNNGEGSSRSSSGSSSYSNTRHESTGFGSTSRR
ncbi:hypothetical protein EJ04DRAFT_509439 [Polyplosphaeria fusca]|uniref:Store-operated calcium entry-associated regulatory factor n=1 Tax=Polyplosphaeria fusca TaxID=682080 RepID=A0A9P4R7L7_9PLEO|nr:hypothetical protein EJ04DRAFT_509439 [Polyplosphaeria fusca]